MRQRAGNTLVRWKRRRGEAVPTAGAARRGPTRQHGAHAVHGDGSPAPAPDALQASREPADGTAGKRWATPGSRQSCGKGHLEANPGILPRAALPAGRGLPQGFKMQEPFARRRRRHQRDGQAATSHPAFPRGQNCPFPTRLHPQRCPQQTPRHPGCFPREELCWPARRNRSFQRLKYILLIRITKSRGEKKKKSSQ